MSSFKRTPRVSNNDSENLRDLPNQFNSGNLDNIQVPIFGRQNQVDDEFIDSDDTRDQLSSGQLAFSQQDVTPLDNDVEVDNTFLFSGGDEEPGIDRTSDREQQNLSILNFVENPLTDFDNYNYKFTWFITPDNVFNAGDPRNSVDKIIISETGKSARFFIRNVEITTNIAPDFRRRNLQYTGIRFEIVEPKGFSLMDAIFSACLELGIPNYFVAPYYLQCDFVAYDDQGIPKNIDTYSKIWALRILDVKANSDSEGTVYQIEAIEYEHVAASNQAAITRANYKIFASTVGTFFDQLEFTMNTDMNKLRDIYREIPDEYVFNVSDEIRGLATTPADDQKDPQQTASDRFYVTKDRVFMVPKGIDIGAIVDNVMTANEAWVKEHIIKDEKDVTQNENDNRFTRIWVVDTQIEIIGFDFIINDYARRYIYNIRPYTSIRGTKDVNQLREDLSNKNKQTQRINSMGRTFSLNKSYEYIYTGRNTEVLNFDIDLNFLWTASIPLYQGIQRLNFTDVGSEVDTSRETLAERERSFIQKRSAFENKVRRFGVGSFENTPESIIAEQQALDTELDEIRNLRNIPTSDETERLSELADRRRLRQTRFIEDVVDSSRLDGLIAGQGSNVASDDVRDNRGTVQQTTTLPVTLVISGDDPETDSSLLVEGTRKQYRSVAGAILNQVYNNSPDLLNIELVIKGDPYWFGVSQVEDRLGLIPESFVPDIFTDIKTKDNLFLIKFRFPRAEEDENGLIESQQSDVISGIYMATEVVHTFENGQFKQTINAIRDSSTNIRIVGGL